MPPEEWFFRQSARTGGRLMPSRLRPKGRWVMERLNQRKSATTGGPRARSRFASRMLRCAVVLTVPLFLASCTNFRQAILKNFRKSQTDFRKVSRPAKKRPVVLKARPRHLMVVPRTEYVWL